MARIRTIKPGFFTSLTIGDLSDAARLLFIGLWTYADDDGRAIDDTRLIKAAVFPLDTRRNETTIEKLLVELDDNGRIARYAVNGRRYLQVVNWAEHQKIDRPGKSILPPPNSKNGHRPPDDDSTNEQRGGGEASLPEGKGKEGKGKEPPLPPRVDNADGHANEVPGGGAPGGEEILTAAETLQLTWPIMAAALHRAAVDTGADIRKPAAWQAKAAHSAELEHHDQAAKLIAEHPDLRPFELAAVLAGDALPIRHRVTPPRDWGTQAEPELVGDTLAKARSAIGRPKREVAS